MHGLILIKKTGFLLVNSAIFRNCMNEKSKEIYKPGLLLQWKMQILGKEFFSCWSTMTAVALRLLCCYAAHNTREMERYLSIKGAVAWTGQHFLLFIRYTTFALNYTKKNNCFLKNVHFSRDFSIYLVGGHFGLVGCGLIGCLVFYLWKGSAILVWVFCFVIWL